MEGILDGADVILLAVAVVEIGELLTGKPLGGVRVGVLEACQPDFDHCWRDASAHLEVKVVLAVLEELRGSNIKTDLDLASVTSLLDGLGKEVEGLLSTRDIGGETTLVTDVGRVNTVLLGDDLLQGVVGLRTHLHGLSEAGSTSGEKHELLEGKGITSVGTTVDDVEGRNGEDVRLRDTGELGEVSIERDAL